MPRSRSSPELSVVIPLYNEEKGIAALFKTLNDFAKKLPPRTEIIFVDDGSDDQTFHELEKKPLKLSKKIIRLSRNFGHQSALIAGLEASLGKYVVTMDGDLQHPLELIPQMLTAHKKGIDIVLTRRIDQHNNSGFKKMTAKFFYSTINLLSETSITENASDFRSMNRTSLQVLLSMSERRKFLRGMVQWIGFSSVTLPFTLQSRAAGKSKYNLWKMMTLSLHGITSFSAWPLYWSGVFSFVLFGLAALYALYVLYVRWAGQAVSGWASVLLAVLVIGGFTSLFLGLIGVYLAAIYDEVKRRPLYVKK